jgi:hypothetical protein
MEPLRSEKQETAQGDLTWSDTETQWLRYEEFIAQVSKLRSPREKPKPWWRALLETSGGAALITVLIGGALGQIISMSIQKSLKERELKLVAYTKFVDQGSETVKHAYALIGTCISASDNLISIKEDKFNPTTISPKDKKNLDEQKSAIVTEYNETNTKWREEQYGLGLLMRYYHRNAMGVAGSWKSVQDSTKDYMDCAGEIKNEPGNFEQLSACKEKKKVLINSLDAFANAVESYWKDIDNTNSR